MIKQYTIGGGIGPPDQWLLTATGKQNEEIDRDD